MPAWLWRSRRRRAGARRAARGRALRRRDQRRARCSTASPAPGPTGAGRAAISTPRRTRAPSYDEMRYMLATPDGGAELAAVVQHRPALGLRHRRPGAGPLLRRLRDRRADAVDLAPTSTRSRTPASSSRVTDDLVNEGGIMDLWVREARIFKYGSGTGTNFSSAARRGRAAVGRRQVLRPDELPQDRRPRRRRDQVGRHHPPRRQDGDPRPRPPRHRGVHQLEGASRSRRSPRWSPARKLSSKHLNAIMAACHDRPRPRPTASIPTQNPALKTAIARGAPGR